ncbi:MAG: hypothetical protein ABI414_13870, partial [Devosia sp.]
MDEVLIGNRSYILTDEAKWTALKISLRIWGVMGLLIFIPLMLGFAVRTPILDAGGALNWSIWNGVTCGDQPCHVPPMLFTIYIVMATFVLVASSNPRKYKSFLDF